MKNHLVEGVIISVIAIAAILGAYQIPASYSDNETWAGLVPMVVACSLLLIGMLMTIAGFRAGFPGRQSVKASVSRADMEVVGLLVLSLLYHQAIAKFGYILPTAVTAPIVLAVFGVRSPAGLLLSAIVCPLVFHLVFFKLLGVFPPYGELFDVLDLIGG